MSALCSLALCQDSYLAPLAPASSSVQASGLYSSPDYQGGEAIQAASLYNGPSNDAFNEVDYQFDLPADFGYASESVGSISSYGSPAESSFDEVYTSYGSPSESVVTVVNNGEAKGAASNTFISQAPATNSFQVITILLII